MLLRHGIDLDHRAVAIAEAALAGLDRFAVFIEQDVAVLVVFVVLFHRLFGHRVKCSLRDWESVLAALVLVSECGGDEAPRRFLVAALRRDGDRRGDREAAPVVAGCAREANVAEVAAQLGKVLGDTVKAVDRAIHGEQLVTVAHPDGILLIIVPVERVVIELRRELSREVQIVDEFGAVEAGCARLPVDERVGVHIQAVGEDVGARRVDVEDRRVRVQLGKRVFQIGQRPRGIAADDAFQTCRRHDGEAQRQLVELAVLAVGVQHRRDQRVAAHVGVDVGVEVFEQPLGRILPHGQAVGQDHIGNIAGHDLRVQFRQAVAALRDHGAVAAGGFIGHAAVFRVILDHDAVFVARAVEFDDLPAQVPVEVHAGERQLGLFRDGRGVHRCEQNQLTGLLVGRAVIVRADGKDAPVGQDGIRVEIVGIHVAGQPVDDLFALVCLGLPAVEVAVVVVVEVIVAAARVDVPGVVRQGQLLAPGLLLGVEHLEDVFAGAVARGAVGDGADLVRAVLREAAAVLVRERADGLSLAVQHHQDLIVGGVEIALAVGVERAEIGLFVAAGLGEGREIERGLKRLLAVRVEAEQAIAGLTLRGGVAGIVCTALRRLRGGLVVRRGLRSRICICLLQQPDAAVLRGAEGHDVRAQIFVVACRIVRLADGLRVEAVGQQLADGGVVDRPFGRRVAVRCGVALILHLRVEKECIAADGAVVNVACLHGQLEILRLIDVFCGQLGIGVVFRLRAVHRLVAGRVARVIFLAAARKHAEQQYAAQQQGQNSSLHRCSSL